ncbi:serine/threonine-protein kinase [Polyangium aurulentum]|uniref:serine/threonine-protein kinase n=1 Tax=Polyangium aurulentum TaxID=2567896 RepID=UPI0010AE7577|nr:serine/threonine-protein kinase [Polyangium aurulentum]UQA58471.1 protein kinase [Polyangium aurulentum]
MSTPGQRGSPPASSPYAPGSVIASKYRLVEIVGEGGMGTVWLARNETLDVEVALKLIRHDTATAETEERLLQEARAAARIDHPSIVRIFDFGETDRGDPFFVMELLRGESLRDLFRKEKRLSGEAAIEILLPVASALAAAHGKGIVHRDLKPENVLLTRDERGTVLPKVVDFGLAKVHDFDRRLTQGGTILGSPDYMSPEQARGRGDLDARTDIWALAVLLYEAVAGKVPFGGANYNALLLSIIEDPPAPWDAGVGDPALFRLVARGLEKDREARWPSMEAFGTALVEWALERGIETDITGTSLAMHWLKQPPRRSLTSAPTMDSMPRAVSTPIVRGLREQQESRASVPTDPDAAVDPKFATAETVQIQPVKAAEVPRARRLAAPLALGALVLGGALVFLFQRPPHVPQTPAPPAPVNASPSVAEAPALTAAPTSTLAPSRPVAAHPAASDPNACAMAQFAPDAFDPSSREFGWMCAETDPRRGATRLKGQVVHAGLNGRVTEAMREWSVLQWYELAAFTVVRARCCPHPARLSLPTIGSCGAIDQALEDIATAATSGGDVEPALGRYRAAVQCAIHSGTTTDLYAYEERLNDSGEAALRKILSRGRPAP